MLNLLRTNVRSASILKSALARSMGTVATGDALPFTSSFDGNKIGGKYTVTLIPGDGIGQETANSVKTVFDAIKAPVNWEQFDVSGFTPESDSLFKQSMESLKRNKVGLKGILHTPVSHLDHASFNVTLRKDLDIFASISVARNIPGYQTRMDNIDLTIIRENTEGEYSGLEHQSYPGVVESLKIITKEKSERIARFAFDYALQNGRKKVTCIHKANIMKQADGLFLNSCRRVAEEYKSSGIAFSDMIVDNAAMQMVSKPQQFDVIVTPNLYGNILGNISAALVGGPGVIPGSNLGREYAIFEPGCRHVGVDIQGKNKANPTAMLLSSVMLLRHLHLDAYADKLSHAVYNTIQLGQVRTPDMGGSHTTTDFTNAVISNL